MNFGQAEAAAIPTHLPDRLEQSADDLPGFAAAPLPEVTPGRLPAAYQGRSFVALFQRLLNGSYQPNNTPRSRSDHDREANGVHGPIGVRQDHLGDRHDKQDREQRQQNQDARVR